MASPQAVPGPVEVDDDSETPSDYGSLTESDTTSLVSSAQHHIYENGRRFHGWREGLYSMANDEEEQNRMDIYHHVVLLALGGQLHLAPIGSNPQRVLDMGTGTGIWAIDFADTYRSAEVLGNDLSPIQPSWVPPNVRFEIDDIEDTWPHVPGSFDFVHGRQLAGFIKDRHRLATQAFTALKPGGYYELMEQGDPMQCDDGTCAKDGVLRQWVNHWADAAEQSGCPWLSVTANGALKTELQNAGFVDVTERVFILPNGTWPKDKKLKEIGAYELLHCLDGAASIMVPFMRVLHWEKERVDRFLEQVIRDLKNHRIHTYATLHVVWGKKPRDGA